MEKIKIDNSEHTSFVLKTSHPTWALFLELPNDGVKISSFFFPKNFINLIGDRNEKVREVTKEDAVQIISKRKSD